MCPIEIAVARLHPVGKVCTLSWIGGPALISSEIHLVSVFYEGD